MKNYIVLPSIDQLHADNCGNAILSPGWIHPRRKLTSSVLILGLKGLVEITIDKITTLKITKGEVALLPAHILHYGNQHISEPASYFWMHFTSHPLPVLLSENEGKNLSASLVATAGDDGGKIILPLNFYLKNSQPFCQSFHDLLYEQECPSPLKVKYQLLFKLLLIKLMETTIAGIDQYSGSYSDITYAVIKIVSLNLTNPNLSVKMIASNLGFNADYVGRQFKAAMGFSVGKFILKKRLQIAVPQLQNGRDTIDKIAANCGFGSLRQFLRQFKQQKGMTPSELRHRYQVMHINNR